MVAKNTKRKNLARRLGTYSAAAAATAATSLTANAVEVVWDIPDVTAGNYPGILFNMINGATALAPASTGNNATGSFRLASYSNFPYIAGPAFSTVAGFVGPGSFGPNDFYPDRLLGGANVGPLYNFGAENDALQYGPYGYLSQNFTNTRGFVGLQFSIGGQIHYGWAELTHLGAGVGTTLHAFGYNDEAGVTSQSQWTVPDGDYNANGVVDAADYTLWRDNLGSTTATLPGDTTPEIVDESDYTVWRSNFGTGPSLSSVGPQSVPEPATGLLALAAGAAGLAAFRSRKQGN